jgi:hypothetical protein
MRRVALAVNTGAVGLHALSLDHDTAQLLLSRTEFAGSDQLMYSLAAHRKHSRGFTDGYPARLSRLPTAVPLAGLARPIAGLPRYGGRTSRRDGVTHPHRTE